MEHKYSEAAIAKGVTLVSMAGYDSVPPDLATWLAAKSMREAGGKLGRIDVLVACSGGAMPSGTINTLKNSIDASKAGLLKSLTCGMCGPKSKPKSETKQKSQRTTYVPKTEAANLSSNLFWSMVPGYSPLAKQFCLPHFMAGINTNVVHRTACHEGYAGLKYRERLGGLPNGSLSLFGLLPTLGGALAGAIGTSAAGEGQA